MRRKPTVKIIWVVAYAVCGKWHVSHRNFTVKDEADFYAIHLNGYVYEVTITTPRRSNT